MVFTRELWHAADGFQALRYCHDLDFAVFACAHSSVFLDRGCEHILYRVHNNNTIAEDHANVRVELAAVVAHGLSMLGPGLLSADLGTQDLDAFLRFLRNRQLTEILCFFTTVLPAFPNRAAFYE
jgi:hypothetical protein